MSVGWVWGYGRSISRDNVIEHQSHPRSLGKVCYPIWEVSIRLAVRRGRFFVTIISTMLMANHYGGWGIYNDEGSSHMLITHNVVHDTKFAGYNIHFAKEVVVRNNIFAFGKLQQLSRSRMEPHKSVFFEEQYCLLD